MQEFPLNRVFTVIEPGPALLVATAERCRKNIMTITWSMAMSVDRTLDPLTTNLVVADESRTDKTISPCCFPSDDLTKALTL